MVVFRPLPVLSASALFVSSVLTLPAAEVPVTLEKTPSGGALIQAGGRPFATYVVDQGNKPYLWPVYGPSGKAMTRAYPMAEVDGEQKDHPHHRGITFGHESIGGDSWRFPEKWESIPGSAGLGGGDTWHEEATFAKDAQGPTPSPTATKRLQSLGKIRHREFTEWTVSPKGAVLATLCEYLDASGRPFLTEQRRLAFGATEELRWIDVDQDLIASEGAVRFDDRKDAGLEIRVPSSMAVDRGGGGEILTSEGARDAAAWAKTARWCAYSGPVEGETLGVAMFSHPGTYRYPTRWHVRTYGLFAANPFGSKNMDRQWPDLTTTLPKGERIRLRHRLVFFQGRAEPAKLNALFEQYAQEAR